MSKSHKYVWSNEGKVFLPLSSGEARTKASRKRGLPGIIPFKQSVGVEVDSGAQPSNPQAKGELGATPASGGDTCIQAKQTLHSEVKACIVENEQPAPQSPVQLPKDAVSEAKAAEDEASPPPRPLWDRHGLDSYELPEEVELTLQTTPCKKPKPGSMEYSPSFDYSSVATEDLSSIRGGAGPSLGAATPPSVSKGIKNTSEVATALPATSSSGLQTPLSSHIAANPGRSSDLTFATPLLPTPQSVAPCMPLGSGISFASAKGKGIQLSEANLNRAAALFADINEDPDPEGFPGFAAGSVGSGKVPEKHGRTGGTIQMGSGGTMGVKEDVGKRKGLQMHKEGGQKIQMASHHLGEKGPKLSADQRRKRERYGELTCLKVIGYTKAKSSGHGQKARCEVGKSNEQVMASLPMRRRLNTLEPYLTESCPGRQKRSKIHWEPQNPELNASGPCQVSGAKRTAPDQLPMFETGGGRRVEVSKSGIRRMKARLGMPVSGISLSEQKGDMIPQLEEKRAGGDGVGSIQGKLNSSLLAGGNPLQHASTTPEPHTPQVSSKGAIGSEGSWKEDIPNPLISPGAMKTPPASMGTFGALASHSYPKLRSSAQHERRNFSHPRQRSEGHPRRPGKSRKSWRPLMPVTPGQCPQYPVQISTSPLPQPVHSLYEDSVRCSLAEYFEKRLELPQPFSVVVTEEKKYPISKSCESLSNLRSHLLSSGCDGAYASDEWCKNHHRWISWKLSSHDMLMGTTSCTPGVILDETKYRYEMEYRKGLRSVLHMVFEQDVASSNGMILAVSKIQVRASHQDVKVELTDGWYPIVARPDGPLSKLFRSGGICVGDKLHIVGARLESAQPEKPLAAYATSFLRIHYNGCHPAKWDEALGSCGKLNPIVRLGLLHPSGGPISRTLVCILRKYPLMYWGKLPSGVVISRTPKAWENAYRAYEERASALEAEIQEEVLKRMQEGSGSNIGSVEKIGLEMLTKGCPLEACLSTEEQIELDKYLQAQNEELQQQCRRILQERLQQENLHNVKEIPFVRILVNDVQPNIGGMQRTPVSAIIKVWRPTEELKYLKEGSVCEATHLSISGKPKNGVWELSSQAQTRWRYIGHHDSLQDKFSVEWVPRKKIGLQDLKQSTYGTCFDYGGYIIFVGHPSGSTWNSQQWIFLADQSLDIQEPFVLAINLTGSRESIDFLDPSLWSGSICTFTDLCFQSVDHRNSLLVATASEISTHGKAAQKLHNSKDTELKKWIEESSDILDRMRHRIEKLVTAS